MAKNPVYYELVFEVVQLIPFGRVSTYGAIADYLALGTPRMVGYALRNALSAQHIPAYRVVNRIGELSGRNNFRPPSLMQELLEQEGVVIINHRVQDFKKLLWIPANEL